MILLLLTIISTMFIILTVSWKKRITKNSTAPGWGTAKKKKQRPTGVCSRASCSPDGGTLSCTSANHAKHGPAAFAAKPMVPVWPVRQLS